MSVSETIHIAAAILIRPDRQVLLVRKASTTAFMQPGGKLEAGESPTQALSRELAEELGLTFASDEFVPFGHFSAAAANEPGATVEADVFFIEVGDISPVAAREIAELRWVDPFASGDVPLAPLTGDEIFTALRIFLTH